MDFTNEKYDNILLDVIQQVNNLPNFLDIIFGFLRRRTDLYYIMNNNQQNMGFLPGNAEKLVLDAFRKHKDIFESTCPSKFEESVSAKSRQTEIIQDSKNKSQESGQDLVYVADAESYNGSVGDCYTWSQTIGELDIRVKIPDIVTKSKDVTVVVDKMHVNVSYTIQNEVIPVIDKELSWGVKKNEVFWSFDPKENKILLSIEKIQERWWEALFVGDATINTRKIDCSRPMSDLDDEAQAKIHKLMHDNRQKQLGLPTSDEQKINEALKKAWDLEGSPFKGKDYNLTNIDIVGNNNN